MKPFTNHQNPFKTPEASGGPVSMPERIALRLETIHRAMIRVEHVGQQDADYQPVPAAKPIDNYEAQKLRPEQQVVSLNLDAIRADIQDIAAGNEANV